MAPFYGWGSTASRLEPLRGGSLLFTTKSPEIPGTHFVDLGRCIAKVLRCITKVLRCITKVLKCITKVLWCIQKY